MAEQEAGEGDWEDAESIRRSMFVYREVRDRIALQFAEGDRLDRRLDSSLRFSGGAVALFGAAIVIALNVGDLGASIETALAASILSTASIFVLNAIVAGIAYTAVSGLAGGAEIGALIDQENLAEEEEDVIWWTIATGKAAIAENTGRLRRKGLLVAISFALTSASTVAIAIGTAWTVLS